MAGSVNKVIIVGNLGADPEVKSFQNGGRICNLRIATSEDWKDKNTGEKKERTEWHTVVLNSDGLVGVAERFLRKGSKVYIEGSLRTRKWQDGSGNDRYSTVNSSCSTALKAVRAAVAVPAKVGAAVVRRVAVHSQAAGSRAATGKAALPALAVAISTMIWTTTSRFDRRMKVTE